MRVDLTVELDENTVSRVVDTGQPTVGGPIMAVELVRSVAVEDWFDSIGQKLTVEMTRNEMVALCEKMLAGIAASVEDEQRNRQKAVGHA